MSYLAWLVSIAFPLLLLARLWRNRKIANNNSLPYPPGPPALPLIGNLLDMPTSYEWLTFSKWAKLYGDIIHMKVLDKHVVVLNSLEAVNELFERRSAKYSDRPDFPMLVDLMGWSYSFAFLKYGPLWRQHRKTFHQFFYPNASMKYIPTQTHSVHQMLQKLLENPDDWMQIIRFALTSTIIQAVYGFQLRDPNEPYVTNAEELMAGLAAAGIPGAFLVDTFPFLKYVPSWFPGAGFKKKAKAWKDLLPDFVDKPYDDVAASMEKGTAIPCVATQLIERIKEKPETENDELVARDVTAIAYAGGADTSVSTIQGFFMAMVLHPDIQRKAQKQLDEVVGTYRLPEFGDIASMPYVEAVVKELFRWQPVTPLAVAHCSTEDDEYSGYYIPKGAIVIGNAWEILHDEKAYPDPMSFKPERFLRADGSLNREVRDPVVAAFGFGRRICPGRHMAINGTLIAVASLLATFNIEQVCDAGGAPALKGASMTPGLLSYPLPFRCKITPRSDAAVKLIKEATSNQS